MLALHAGVLSPHTPGVVSSAASAASGAGTTRGGATPRQASVDAVEVWGRACSHRVAASARPAHGRARRPRPPTLRAPRRSRRVSAGEAAAHLRLRHRPQRRPCRQPHPGHPRVGQEGPAAAPHQRLRPGPASPTCSSLWHRGRHGRVPGPRHPGHETGQRAGRSRRRHGPDQDHRPLRPGRPALHRRTRLHGTRPPRRRTALPSTHRTRGESLRRHRLQRVLRRLDQDLHRPRLCAAIVDRLAFGADSHSRARQDQP